MRETEVGEEGLVLLFADAVGDQEAGIGIKSTTQGKIGAGILIHTSII